jgi:Ca2+-binding RTX toxin-like protein
VHDHRHARPDILVGTPGRNVICRLGEDDVLDGQGGNDILRGGPGKDILNGRQRQRLLAGGRERQAPGRPRP